MPLMNECVMWMMAELGGVLALSGVFLHAFRPRGRARWRTAPTGRIRGAGLCSRAEGSYPAKNRARRRSAAGEIRISLKVSAAPDDHTL